MSRILVWSPNYAPELTGIPPLVTDACRWLAGRGHEVEVVTAFPNYPQRRIDPAYRGSLWRSEVLDGVGVHRSWLRVRPGESSWTRSPVRNFPRLRRPVSVGDVVRVDSVARTTSPSAAIRLEGARL